MKFGWDFFQGTENSELGFGMVLKFGILVPYFRS